MLDKIEPGRLLRRYVGLLLVLYAIDAAALYYGINLPVAILYGPLIYIVYTYVVNKPAYFSYLHLVPFLLLSFIYVLGCFGILFNVGWVWALNRVFFACYYVVIPISLILYCLMLFFHLDKESVVKRIILAVCAINLLYAFLFMLIGAQNIFPGFLSPLNFQLFPLYFFPGISAILLLYYMSLSRNRVMDAIMGGIDQKETLSGIAAAEVVRKLKECLEYSELYLNPVLSLEMLAEKMEMPKHQLSYFLNAYIGKTFYQVIAEYRVGYAKRKLEEGHYLTIESLAYECGFNSKTSLNKYFREITGVAPSQYRSDIK